MQHVKFFDGENLLKSDIDELVNGVTQGNISRFNDFYSSGVLENGLTVTTDPTYSGKIQVGPGTAYRGDGERIYVGLTQYAVGYNNGNINDAAGTYDVKVDYAYSVAKYDMDVVTGISMPVWYREYFDIDVIKVGTDTPTVNSMTLARVTVSAPAGAMSYDYTGKIPFQTKNITEHSSTHKLGGGDLIKLDELGTPDNNTNLNASTSRHGLLPILDNDATHYLDGQGNWSAASPTVAFTDLTDVPSSYSGESSKFVRVNSGETALEFIPASLVTGVTSFNSRTGTVVPATNDYSFSQLSDVPQNYGGGANQIVRVNGTATGLTFDTFNFIDLSDAPNSYGGGADKYVRVNATATGLTFATVTSGGGGKTVIWLLPGSAKLPNTNYARPYKNVRTNVVDDTLRFDADGTGNDEAAYWQYPCPSFYGGGNLTITVYSVVNDTNAAHLAEFHFYCGAKEHAEAWDAAPTEIGNVNINPTGTAYDLLVDTIAWTANLPTAGDMLLLKSDVDNSDSTLAADLGVLAIKIEED